MKVVLVTPYYHQPRGNTITVERISLGLTRLGISTEIVSVTRDNGIPLLPSGDLVHGFNAYHFHQFWQYRGSLSNPYLITLTGTDINHALLNEKNKDRIIKTLEGSKAIHVFNQAAKTILQQEVPALKDKIYLIPQGTYSFPEDKVNKEDGSFIFALPAGIRRVKNIPAAISLLTPLYEQDPRIRLWIVGPVIEKEEWHTVQKLVQENSSWIRYWGEISHAKMGQIYRYADVILNTSLAEGQSSAILEAMATGVPVLVSDIAGNRDIVHHGKTGFLYHDITDFTHYVRRLMDSEELREKMGRMGQEYIEIYHSSEKEAKALQKLYHEILGKIPDAK
ncbi:MAG TPA: glycosyltransferase [Desulfobacteria bacterium]|nr:glycosyltransferase [Desulfobacteria bacterium]